VGVPLLEGYGLTETAPVVTATTFEESLPGSVGRPLCGVELALGKNDELLVKSPSMMLGYWQNDDATRAVLDPSGWLRTGDIAELKDGRVFIRGRLKDLIVLSTGENVATGDVEAAIAKDPLFDQICIVGNARPCLVAVAVLEPETWRQLAAELNVDTNEPNSKIAKTAILARIHERIIDLSRPDQVRAVIAVTEPWTVADGALTPTLKIKRRVIEARYKEEISAIYRTFDETRLQVAR
jgi:long-chain acyl-CoA synthetase